MGETLLTYEGVSVTKEGQRFPSNVDCSTIGIAALVFQHSTASLCECCTELVAVFLPLPTGSICKGGLPVLWTITDKILNDSVHKAALPRGKRSGEGRTWGVHSW